MSLQTELEEMAKWIAELTAPPAPAPPEPAMPAREEWRSARDLLRKASENFSKAAVALPSSGEEAGFAQDVARDADDLALRADVLALRALPKPKHRRAAAHPAEGEGAEHRERGASPPPGQGGSTPSPHDLVQLAAREVEEARTHLHPPDSADASSTDSHHVQKDPEGVAADFDYELEVLAEMALSLRQMCARLEPTRPAGEAVAAKEANR